MDFRSANDAKLEGVPDPEVPRIAVEQERILERTAAADWKILGERISGESGDRPLLRRIGRGGREFP